MPMKKIRRAMVKKCSGLFQKMISFKITNLIMISDPVTMQKKLAMKYMFSIHDSKKTLQLLKQ